MGLGMQYGLGAFGGRFTATPELVELGHLRHRPRVRPRLAAGACRSGPSSFELGLEATRGEAANDDAPEHGVRLKLRVRF